MSIFDRKCHDFMTLVITINDGGHCVRENGKRSALPLAASVKVACANSSGERPRFPGGKEILAS